MANNRIAAPVTLEVFQAAAKTFTLTVLDADGDAVSLSGKALRFVYETDADPPVAQQKMETSTITIGGSGNNVVTVPLTASETPTSGRYRWRLWNTTDDQVLQHGPFVVRASTKDTS